MTENNRLLVMDDERDIVQAYIDFLDLAPAPIRKSSRSAAVAPSEAHGYEIFKAYSGEEAIEIVTRQFKAGLPIAGGFFDVKMEGGIDGIQTILNIWAIDPKVHCTIVTAYQDRSVQDIDQLFGPNFKDQWDYLNKPFTSGEIIQKARQMLGAWNRTHNLESTLDQLKAAQVQLVESERLSAIGQVARGVGHEFGNILQQIVGKADLGLHTADPEKLKTHLLAILQAGESAAIIVRNLQSFSKNTPMSDSVDTRQVMGSALTLINHNFIRRKILCEDKRQAVPLIRGVVSELGQVFVNLLINSMDAIPATGGTIEVGCQEESGAIHAWVRDSGGGIKPEVLPKIFEYAFTTKGDKGSGLGLSISKQIIEKHGGHISVQSVLQKGTTFDIILPATPVPQT